MMKRRGKHVLVAMIAGFAILFGIALRSLNHAPRGAAPAETNRMSRSSRQTGPRNWRSVQSFAGSSLQRELRTRKSIRQDEEHRTRSDLPALTLQERVEAMRNDPDESVRLRLEAEFLDPQAQHASVEEFVELLTLESDPYYRKLLARAAASLLTEEQTLDLFEQMLQARIGDQQELALALLEILRYAKTTHTASLAAAYLRRDPSAEPVLAPLLTESGNHEALSTWLSVTGTQDRPLRTDLSVPVSPETLGALSSSLNFGGTLQEKQNAAVLLGQLGSRPAMETMIKALSRSESAELNAQLITQLAEAARDDESAALLGAAFLDSPADSAVRYHLEEAIRKVPRDRLQQATGEDWPRLREQLDSQLP